MSANSRTNDAADQLSGLAEPAGSPSTKPIEAVSGGVPNGEAARFADLPVLLGNEADAAGELVHAVEQGRRAGRVAGLQRSAPPRSADSAGQRCPVPTPDGAHGRPSLERSP